MQRTRVAAPRRPASPPRPGAAAAQRRERILRAARTVFSQRGYRRTNLDQVRRLAAVSKATLYHEFGSKDGLLLAVAGRGVEELRAHMIAALATPGSPRRIFGCAIRSALAFFDDNRALAQILFLEASEIRGQVLARYLERYEATKSAAGPLFRACARPGLLARSSPGELADYLMYLLAGRVMVWVVRGEPGPLEPEADRLADLYARGVFAAEVT